MANAENKADFGKVNLTSQINILHPGAADDATNVDAIASIVNQMLSRENENEQAAKKLKELIRKEGKRQIQMTLTIQEKESVAEKLARSNENVDDDTANALNVLQNLQRSLANRREQEAAAENLHSGVKPTVQSLKKLLNDLSEEIKSKEKQLNESPPKREPIAKRRPKSDGRNEPGTTSAEDKDKELERNKNLLADLKEAIKDWLTRLSNTLRKPNDKKTEQEFSTFAKGVRQIIEFLDACLEAELNYDKLKKDKDEKDTYNTELHNEVSKRLNERKPLERIPPKVRREFEKMRRECVVDDDDGLPETQRDVVAYLEQLYAWGDRRLDNGECRSNEIGDRIEEAKSDLNSEEKMRKLDLTFKDEEIRMYEDKLERLKQENRRLQCMVDESKRDTTIRIENKENINQQPPT